MSKKNRSKQADVPVVEGEIVIAPAMIVDPPAEVSIPVDTPAFMSLEAGQALCASYGGHADTDEACTNPKGDGTPCEIAGDCIAFQASTGASPVGEKKAKKAKAVKTGTPTRVDKKQTWDEFVKMVYSGGVTITKLLYRALIEEDSFDATLARLEREEKEILGKDKPFYTPGAYSKIKGAIDWSSARGCEYEVGTVGGFLKLVNKHVVG
jgi:hypothetical protein